MTKLILVEDKKHEYFLKLLISKLQISNLLEIKTSGNNNKSNNSLFNKSKLESNLDEDNDFAIIGNAGHCYDTTRKSYKILKNLFKIKNSRNEEDYNFYDYYLFPNNQDSGSIETLLMKILQEEYKNIIDCFNCFTNCVVSRLYNGDKGSCSGIKNNKSQASGIKRSSNLEGEALNIPIKSIVIKLSLM